MSAVITPLKPGGVSETLRDQTLAWLDNGGDYEDLARKLFTLDAAHEAGRQFRVAKFNEQDARIAALEAEVVQLRELLAQAGQRVAQIEQRGYKGVWNAHTPADFVTWDGSMWAAKRANKGVCPGRNDDSAANDDWQLAVRRGRPGSSGR
jgi:hypothetical protein